MSTINADRAETRCRQPVESLKFKVQGSHLEARFLFCMLSTPYYAFSHSQPDD